MMMSRKVLIGIVIGIGIISCSGVSSEELASLAAKGYYEHLIHGEYEKYLEGKVGLNAHEKNEYWSQLIDNCHQFMRQQETSHRGVREVRIVNATTDTIQKYTNVFMVLCFGDSTNEEIVVPMVEQNGRWFMK